MTIVERFIFGSSVIIDNHCDGLVSYSLTNRTAKLCNHEIFSSFGNHIRRPLISNQLAWGASSDVDESCKSKSLFYIGVVFFWSGAQSAKHGDH